MLIGGERSVIQIAIVRVVAGTGQRAEKAPVGSVPDGERDL